jgi:hypothetical protein
VRAELSSAAGRRREGMARRRAPQGELRWRRCGGRDLPRALVLGGGELPEVAAFSFICFHFFYFLDAEVFYKTFFPKLFLFWMQKFFLQFFSIFFSKFLFQTYSHQNFRSRQIFP